MNIKQPTQPRPVVTATEKSHPSYHPSRGFTLPLPSGGRRRQIGASP